MNLLEGSMRAAVSVVVFAVSLSVSAAEWEKEPADFRGVKFGASEAEVVAALKLPKASCMTVGGQRGCLHHGSMGDVRTTEIFQFDNGAFAGVYVEFPASRFEFLRDVFVERYGAPAATRTPTVKTKVGAEFTNEILDWRGTAMAASIERYTGSIDTGSAIIGTVAWFEAQNAESEAAKKKAASEF